MKIPISAESLRTEMPGAIAACKTNVENKGAVLID
jgi:hypothetical protein